MDVVVNAVAFLAGAAMVLGTVGSAVRTVILPRDVPAKLATVVFVTMRRTFNLRLRRVASYEKRDRIMALYAPLSLRLDAAGVPLVPDREKAWQDFRGWRVNYDTVLVTLASLVMALYAPWSSDRSVAFRVRALRRTR